MPEKHNKISKSNALIEAGYRLSLTEMQVVLYGISLINPIQKDFPLQYKIEIKRFAELFNRSHKDIYTEVKNAILKRFWDRSFSYTDEDGKIIVNRWLTQVTHDDGSGFISIKFNSEIKPYLHNLQGNFTSYYINQIANFKSIYSVRFYEFIILELDRSKKIKCKFSLSIDDIKKRLELGNKYQRFYDFKLYVLEKSKKEINKFSDLSMSYCVKKIGRHPKEIEISAFKKETKKVKKLSSSEYTKIGSQTLDKVKELSIKAGTGWDVYEIEKQFYEYRKRKGEPNNLDGAFIGFVKKKIGSPP